MTNPLNILVLANRLGFVNSAHVLRHRQRIKRGHYTRKLPITAPQFVGKFWDVVLKPSKPHAALITRGDEICNGIFRRFDYTPVTEGEKPQWLKGVYRERQHLHCLQVPINDVAGEDVKLTWDLSRFKWVTQLALAALHSQEPQKYMDRLNLLTTDWLRQHDYQSGVLWFCSQEVSLRGLQLMLSTELLGGAPTSSLLELMEQSYKRVKASIHYALAQQNNHSYTELMFLFYAARFLGKYGITIEHPPERRQVAALVKKLIQPDGSCAMPSLNYHRVFCDLSAHFAVLDDYLNVGLWRDGTMRICATRMIRFLENVIEPQSGGVPNIGHNDGSQHAFQFTPAMDYVPTLLLMSAVFGVPIAKKFKSKAENVYLFGRTPVYADTPTVMQFDDFGLLIVDKPKYRAYLKYPRNRFRPLQSDFLHLDVWAGGKNILHDSGTFSYNPPTPDDLDDDVAHNGLVVLGKPFVKKLSRFLYAYWPNAQVEVKGDEVTARVSNNHCVTLSRRIHFGATSITIEDSATGAHEWGVAFNFPGAISANAFQQGRWQFADNAVLVTPDACEQKIASPCFAPWYQEKAASCRMLVLPSEQSDSIISDIIIE